MAQAALKLRDRRQGDPDTLSPRDFERLASLINDRTGIKLPAAKRSMVEGRLRKRLRVAGEGGFHSYCRFLFDEGGLDEELPFLIDAVTTNKTDFFREPEHFELLASQLLPDLLALPRPGATPLLKIWSAASANGAEAYSIAMLLSDLAAARRDFRFAVLGTDISNTVLAQARLAIYPAEMVKPVPRPMQDRYVMRPLSRTGTDVRIAPELRRLVRFEHLNLMDGSYPFDHDVDVIFLRNVLIYFDKRDQHSVIARLAAHLRPRGYLLLGHSESMVGADGGLRQVAPAVFQKA